MPANAVSFRYVILGLLNQKPRSGYDIKRLLKSLNWLVDGPSFGNIYATLHALLQEGLVSVEIVPHPQKPPRKVYSLTESGERALREWSERPMASKVSLKAFVMRLILADSFSNAHLAGQLEQRQAQVAERAAALAQAAAALDAKAGHQRLALDYGLALANAELAWLDRALERLSKQPLPTEAGGPDRPPESMQSSSSLKA